MSNTLLPSQTLTIDNNTYTLESDSNSILVINTPSISETRPNLNPTPETNPITTSKHDQIMNKSSNNMIDSNGYLKQLESELAKTKQKLEEASQENVLIKEYNTHLARKLEKKHKTSVTEDEDDDDDSIVAYIDVQNIANKLEYYLIETSKLFKTDQDCIDSFKFLIKNIWSLIAHEYNEKNLEQFKKVRDELLNKLDKVNLNQSQINMVNSLILKIVKLIKIILKN